MSLTRLLATCVQLHIVIADFASCSGPRTRGAFRSATFGNPGFYDKFERPSIAFAVKNGSFGAMPAEKVNMHLQVNSVLDIDTSKQTFTLDARFRLFWYDWRLAFLPFSKGGCFSNPPHAKDGELEFKGALIPEIWNPTVDPLNMAGKMTVLENTWWLYPSGLVWWTRKIQIKLSCAMSFSKMPFDIQICPMEFSFQRDDLEPHFYHNMAANFTKGSLDGVVEWDLAHVTWWKSKGEDVESTLGSGGFGWVFEFVRRPDYYFSYVVVPCYSVIFLCWCSFFISREAALARTAVPIICFLVLTGQAIATLKEVPHVKTTWLSSFLTGSSWFVVYAAVEFAIVNLLSRVEKRVSYALKQCELPRDPCTLVIGNPEEAESSYSDSDVNQDGRLRTLQSKNDPDFANRAGKLGMYLYSPKLGRLLLLDRHLDVASRYLFPVAYMLFTWMKFNEVGRA